MLEFKGYEVTKYIKGSFIISEACSSAEIIGVIKQTTTNGRDSSRHWRGRVHIESVGRNHYDNIKSDSTDIWCEIVDWIVLALDSLQRQASVIIEINHRLP
jgi:hypothetical protein